MADFDIVFLNNLASLCQCSLVGRRFYISFPVVFFFFAASYSISVVDGAFSWSDTESPTLKRYKCLHHFIDCT